MREEMSKSVGERMKGTTAGGMVNSIKQGKLFGGGKGTITGGDHVEKKNFKGGGELRILGLRAKGFSPPLKKWQGGDPGVWGNTMREPL